VAFITSITEKITLQKSMAIKFRALFTLVVFFPIDETKRPELPG